MMADSLADLRQKIDSIDERLLGLLAERQQLSRAVARQKKAGSNIFRPDREVSLLRNLMAQRGTVSPRLIIGIWRHIISASIAEQKPDYTISYSPLAADLAQTHGAGYMKLKPCQTVEAATRALAQELSDCVVIAKAELDQLAPHLGLHEDGSLFVVASIGFLQDDTQARGYILCRELPALSGDDVLLVRSPTGDLSEYDTDEAPAEGVIVGTFARPISLGTFTIGS